MLALLPQFRKGPHERYFWFPEVFPETALLHASRWSSACLPLQGPFMHQTVIWWTLAYIIDLLVSFSLSARRFMTLTLLKDDDSLI